MSGEAMLHLREHVDAREGQRPYDGVTMLPGHDQWVLGAGTADGRIVPVARRGSMTRGANPVLHAGVVAGTRKIARDTLSVSWLAEAASPPRTQVDSETERLRALVGHHLDLDITVS